jgi:hypothetical protein
MDSNGFWIKTEYNSDGKEIYFEDSNGFIIDKRPKPVVEMTLQDIADKLGIDMKTIRIKDKKEIRYNNCMSKKEIQQEIEKLRSQIQTLEKKLAQSSNLADEQVREEINDAARIYNNTLIQKGGLQGIGEDRDWEWIVDVETDTNSEVLVRVDTVTGELID